MYESHKHIEQKKQVTEKAHSIITQIKENNMLHRYDLKWKGNFWSEEMVNTQYKIMAIGQSVEVASILLL